MQASTDRRSRTSSCIFFPPPAPAWTAPNMLTNLLPLAPLLWSLSSKRKGLDETPQHEKQRSAGSTRYAEERRPRWCSQHLGMLLPVTLPQETRLSQEVTETPAQQHITCGRHRLAQDTLFSANNTAFLSFMDSKMSPQTKKIQGNHPK